VTVLVWRVEALQDFETAFHWYDEQRDGLGSEFARDVDIQAAALLRFPRAHPVVFQDARRTILKRFPFGVYYLIEEAQVVVLAVLHMKRDVLALLATRHGGS